MKKYTTLDLFLETNLRHLYNAEKKVRANLAHTAELASTRSLYEAVSHHIQETEH